jgi:signal transduction histidine kinase
LNGILVETAAGWQQINAGDGLPGNRVTALAESPDGRIWVGTQSGVASISPDLTSVFQHPGLTDSPVGACGVQNNGLVWIATASSLTLYDRSRSFLDTVPPRIELRGIAVNGSPRMYTAGMRLSNIENNIRIDVASIRMRKADALRYQYRFVGIDSAWSAASASRNLSFPALQPGSYALEIRALSAELIPSIAPLFLRFSVSPPFWQRWWFYPAIVVTIGLVLMAFYRIRMQRLLATERIRTRIAADLHDDIGSGLTRIAMMSDVMMQQTRQVTEGLQADATFSLDGLRSTISRSGTIARELVESMSDVVWSLDPRNDSVGQIADRLRVFAFDLADGAEITLDFTVTDVARQLRTSSEISRSLLLVMKEALSNTVRHANANHLRVQISSADSSMSFLVEDDGRGFDPDRLARRSGLVHMEQRVASCGGSFEVRTSLDSGTHISGTIPLS